ncbi:P-loop containing nucleoside triphosphate hydrolase protein [Ascobolus immersus RN42]|uniref:P-loop containing nucleoside triphosphate hydrolase protein n=1 Tax=Ascobolus immersus RN42 TaxID=1160509 RepID=A0A3N4HZ99_ASCIM|nr:P-loop containing nucleoside triphosphate hydrolase protein [Ascobolus immersus RN42]
MGQRFIGGAANDGPADADDLEKLSSYAPTESTITNFGPPPGTYTPQSSLTETDSRYHYSIPQNLSTMASRSLGMLHNASSHVSIKNVLKLLSEAVPIKFVATMGLTGHGKSTLIKLLTPVEQHKAITTNGGMMSGTKDFHMHPVMVPGLPLFILIDFPGFDSADMKDSEVLEIIYSWFSHMAPAGVKLTTILYVHDITAPRLTPRMQKGFDIFKAIVGQEAFRNVGIVGTKWDYADHKPRTEKKFRMKEQELCEELWADVIAGGARIHRSKGVEEDEDDSTYGGESYTVLEEEWEQVGESAREILREHTRDQKVQLQIQREIEEHKLVWQTEAGKLLVPDTPHWQELVAAEAQMEMANMANEADPRMPKSPSKKKGESEAIFSNFLRRR